MLFDEIIKDFHWISLDLLEGKVFVCKALIKALCMMLVWLGFLLFF